MVRGGAAGRGGRRAAASSGSSSRPSEESPATVTAPKAGQESEPAAGNSARRGAATSLRATRAAPAARFRPRNVRREESERDNLARQEEQKVHERAAEERRARGRSRNRSKRSRGDMMGSRGGRGQGTATASGPFSAGFSTSSSLSRVGGWKGAGGSGSGTSFGGSTTRGARPLKSEPQAFGESKAAGSRETRINADKLHALTPDESGDSDDEAMMNALQQQATSTMPMGIYRREHKETGVVVATTAELEAAEKAKGEDDNDSLWVDGDGARPPAIAPAEEGVWNTRAGKRVVIKQEEETEDAMDLDAEVKPPEGQQEAAVRPRKMLADEDSEERRIQDDLELLASELGATSFEGEGEQDGAGVVKDKDGRMYLFQFPPLMPPLKRAGSRRLDAVEIKKEPRSQDGVDMAVDYSRETRGRSRAHDEKDREGGEDEAEDQGEGDGDGLEDEAEEEAEGFRGRMPPQGGIVGQLQVRRSGKVELDWGGLKLEMSPAAGMNFVTTAVMIEEADEKAQQDGAGSLGGGSSLGGESIGMGKIMGRFVLAPVWSEEEEWKVAPEQLEEAGGG